MKNNLEITRWWFFCNDLKYCLKWWQWSGQQMIHEWRLKEQKPTHQMTGGFSLPNNNNNNLSSKFNFKMKEEAYSAAKPKAEINENQLKRLKRVQGESYFGPQIFLLSLIEAEEKLERQGLIERPIRWVAFIILFFSLSRNLLHCIPAFVSIRKHTYWMCLRCMH